MIGSFSRPLSKVRGFTLTELAIVLGVSGLILGAIWAAASSVILNSRVRVTVDTLMIIVDNAHNFYSNSNQLPASGANEGSKITYTASLAKVGVFPQSILKVVGSDKLPFNLWNNGNIYIFSGSSNTYFRMALSNVPKDYCAKIITGMLGANGLTAVKLPVGGWKTNGTTGYNGITAGPIATANTICSADQELQFEFSMHYAPM